MAENLQISFDPEHEVFINLTAYFQNVFVVFCMIL
ncbi:hypothetical protein BSUW23_01240 [Bacillus spizizenii str. W23]|uniref:Uncharacterized protein n=1 Tax=Bacillus spizizenii (strain ATCC 23059 / NRRL B-14472 / W23) TaxID=655816 RepID=E0U0V2_BACSH|nr:hypothetical protein BSUW23_01240 [Bacillus spizizenii str. W23]EFG91582.1 hypothetical protein BSU6633_13892 [Bacillus spizizenii ATCC 6633 = JCM 2499]